MTAHSLDIQDQLTQMTSEDPNGAQAEILLRRLTIFEGTFDSAAAAALAPTGMTDAEIRAALITLQQWGLIGQVAASEPLPLDDRVLEAIPRKGNAFATLQDWGFLERETIPTRYFVPKTVRRALPPEDGAAERHDNHYHRLHSSFGVNSRADRFALIARDWPNLHPTLLRGLGARKPQKTIQWVWSLRSFLYQHLAFDAQFDLFNEVLTAAERCDDMLEQANALKALGDVAQRDGQLSRAASFYSRALPHYEELRLTQGRASLFASSLIHDVFDIEERLETAIDLYSHISELPHIQVAAVSQLLLCYHWHDVLMTLQDFQAAQDVMLETFGVYEQLRDELGQCDTLTILGHTAAQSGDMDKARDYFAWALRMGERLSYHIGKMKTLWAWGQAEYKSGHQQAGRALCRQAIVVVMASPTVNDHARADVLRGELGAMEDGPF